MLFCYTSCPIWRQDLSYDHWNCLEVASCVAADLIVCVLYFKENERVMSVWHGMTMLICTAARAYYREGASPCVACWWVQEYFCRGSMDLCLSALVKRDEYVDDTGNLSYSVYSLGLVNRVLLSATILSYISIFQVNQNFVHRRLAISHYNLCVS